MDRYKMVDDALAGTGYKTLNFLALLLYLRKCRIVESTIKNGAEGIIKKEKVILHRCGNMHIRRSKW